MGEVSEFSYVLNSMFLLFCGTLVMLMAAGFAMLEAGMVRSKSVAVILVKNVGLYAVAGLVFYVIGYNLMYRGVDGGFFGVPGPWVMDDSAALSGDYSAGYSSASDWFFQMVFVATAASIVSGALAERIKLIPFFVFCIILTGFIYPVTGSWVWGGGWLSEMGFSDFAGSTLVHSVGGWAALAGAILLGARRGRFGENGESIPLHGSSMPLVTLGTFILWFGWFGFNGGSQLAIASVEDAIAVSQIFAHTNIAAAAGVVTIIIIGFVGRGRLDVPMVLNGALAGLVAITADPLHASFTMSIFIGAIGAIGMYLACQVLDYFRIDDVVGAVPVHLVGGIIGTIFVAFTNPEAKLGVQLIGIFAVGGFVFTISYAIWMIMKVTQGIRLHWSHEEVGSDLAELGVRAYNLEFGETHKT
jgi:Amt family ammonium transporter